VDQVINYRHDNFAQAVLDLTGGRGVDVVFDAVGAATVVDDTKALKTFGTLVSFGGASGPAQLSASELRPKSLRWGWFGVFNAYGQPDVWARGVANLVPLIASGAVDPFITGVYAREQAPEAHRLLEGRASQGKLALVHPN
jgi:NADPH2:quinone reductase